MMKQILYATTAAALALASTAARADEGMWTFDNFPAAKMRADHGWAPDQAWLDNVRGAAVRLTGGCSASFVSSTGLVLTNHHCVVGCLQDLSTGDSDLVANGFNAQGDRARERACPGQQAEVVTAITDVTKDVKAAFAGLTGEALIKARDAQIAKIEQENCTDRDKTRCQVVTLYGGGEYKLYNYRKYSDVRIVWAPEFAAAFFGGDLDNFNFPRYAMDAAFLRAYENGKPVATPAHLKWDARAPKDGEATFVVGNPGSTSRLYTTDQIAFEREVRLPVTLTTMSELRGRLITAMEQSPEKKREGGDTLFGIENSLKVYIGRSKALNDATFLKTLADNEAALKAKSAGKLGDPWGDIAAAMGKYRDNYMAVRFSSPSSDLYSYAKTLVRAAEERTKPNSERLRGFTDSALPLTQKTLLDAKPVYPWLEELTLEWSLSKAREYLGADNSQTQLMLGKESPEGLAKRLVTGTKLADPAFRKQLWEGGAAAIKASDDPMIQYALKLDKMDRDLTKLIDEQVNGPATAAGAKLSDARFAAYGSTQYPDATFTLRISYGKVEGWKENGQMVPTTTKMGGTFTRATGNEPFAVAKAFAANEAKINKNRVYDFVTTNDIIGGNSGSPVIDRNGRVIGTAFDGNIHSLGGNYGYQGEVNRTVAVSTDAIQEALTSIYPAPALVAELAGKGKK